MALLKTHARSIKHHNM